MTSIAHHDDFCKKIKGAPKFNLPFAAVDKHSPDMEKLHA
jgi:hypothetical protein